MPAMKLLFSQRALGLGTASRPRSFAPHRRPQTAWRGLPALQATQGDSEVPTPGASAMSLEDAYKALGLKAGASFDECLQAKNKLLARHDGDQAKCAQVDQAYDCIVMSQLNARLRGELNVSTKVRFADVATQPKKKPKAPSAPQMSALGVAVAPPRGNDLNTQAAVFGALAAWILIQDWFTPASVDAAAVPGVQLALAAAAAVYFLREQKRAGLGKALGLATAGLVAGSLLGSAMEAWLRVDIVPLAEISSPGTVVGEFALAALAAVSILLR